MRVPASSGLTRSRSFRDRRLRATELSPCPQPLTVPRGYDRPGRIGEPAARLAVQPRAHMGRTSGENPDDGVPLEAAMADTVGTDRQSDAASPDAASPDLALTDGRPHPLLNLASAFVLVAGLVAFVLGMLLRYDSGTGKAVAIAAAAIGLVTL